MPTPLLGPARPEDAAAITAMVRRSKRSWGYSDAFMGSVATDLTITPRDIGSDHVEVLRQDGAIVGVLRLQRRPDYSWLEDLFVEPDVMGQGLGRRLFERAVACSREWGYREMRLESDPNAEPFYRRMGAIRVGTSPSSVMPGRELPLMRYEISDDHEPMAQPG